PGVALVCFAADCTPVLLFDPVKNVAAAVHAGWRGTANGIVRKTVEKMAREFGSNPADIGAAIGPCISQCCFETDLDVPQAMLAAFGPEADAYIEKRGEKYFVDNKGLNRLWLTRMGVTNIDVSQDCTMCQPERFWSHRVTKGYRGSQTGIIELQEAAQ
ncbi:MAG: peptidoglycan editing factor PgeF, partial [Clostridiales bacterium]|nr:peptidoglycan editing factor PgeF [Clostridiales bacterium]